MEIPVRYELEIEPMPMDLLDDGARQALYHDLKARGLDIDMLINTARTRAARHVPGTAMGDAGGHAAARRWPFTTGPGSCRRIRETRTTR